MDYREAIKQKNTLLSQMEEMGKKMSELQHFIDNYESSITQFKNKYVCIHKHHYMYVLDIDIKDSLCIFKGICITDNGNSTILEDKTVEFTIEKNKITESVKEISKFDFVKVLSKGFANFISLIAKYTSINVPGFSYQNQQ